MESCPDCEEQAETITQAIELISEYGGIDGGHHKQWLLDQVLRVLMNEDTYNKWLAVWQDGEDGPLTYEWDKGIAP